MSRRRWALALCLATVLAGAGADPQIYRWKDKRGEEHVTNTPPPPGATPLEVPPLENTREPEKKVASQPRAGKAAPQAARPLSAEQEAAWKTLEQKLAEARARGDVQVLEAAADGVMQEALWGNGVWALALLPLATLAMVTLLGWWAGSGFRRPIAIGITLLFALGGLAVAQLCLAHFVYRAQALRLRTAVVALRSHLGTQQGLSPEHAQRLDGQMASVESATQPLAPPWRFPQEVRALGETLRQVMVNP